MIGVAIAAGAAAGIAATAHCAAMCGPVAAFAGKGLRGAAQYHGARALSYAVAGAIAGSTGTLLADAVSGRWAGALMSWSLALALAWSAWRLWRGGDGAPVARSGALTQLGRTRQPLGARLLARLPRHPAAVGGLTVLLPCGSLYTALFLAAGSGDALSGALAMATFALASGLGLGALSLIAARARNSLARRTAPSWIGRAFAVALLVGAFVLVVRPIDSLRLEQPTACCNVHV